MSDEIVIVKGTDTEIPVYFKDENWTAINLVDATVFFTVKEDITMDDPKDDNAIIIKDVTEHTAPLDWLTTIVLTALETSVKAWGYSYDLKIKTSWGLIYCILTGLCTILQSTTQRAEQPEENPA